MSSSSDLADKETPPLSPTASLHESMVSMKTEDHNELYDHRQHDDPMDMANANTTSPHTHVRPHDLLFSNNNNNSSNDQPALDANSQLDDAKNSGTNSAAAKRRMSKARSMSTTNSMNLNHANLLAKTASQKSDVLPSNADANVKNPNTRNSFDSENSQASRESQETEEDVCFPMGPALHTRVNGIDFDELEEFAIQVNEQKQNYYNSMNYNNIYNTNFCSANAMDSDQINKSTSQAIASSSSSLISSAALKYTPRQEKLLNSDDTSTSQKDSHDISLEDKHNDKSNNNGVFFGNNKIEDEFEEESKERVTKHNTIHKKNDGDSLTNSNDSHNPPANEQMNFTSPIRYSYFCSESEETVHAEDIASLVKDGESYFELFHGGEPTWWLDCSCPTDDEMRCIAKAFGIHPLTAEDIRMQETREKVEMFKSYYFICFHTFENDKESEDYLEPINVYIVVLRTGILTFHFGPISHCANVRRRVRQLRDYVNVSSDWLCYALIDDITDGFAPVIQSIEYEADTIEDTVFMVQNLDFSGMLQKIGESRRKVMTLMRLLSGKADVIKMFAKRCQDEYSGIGPALTSYINIANLQAANNNMNYNMDSSHNFTPNGTQTNIHGSSSNTNFIQNPTGQQPSFQNQLPSQPFQNTFSKNAQPRSDIALYLGDIQDHLLTMYQNLLAYEKIFSRSHSNYLAQLQVESFNSNNKVTEMLGKVTMIGTMLVPLNVITGLFGMNVKVPGEGGSIAWWFGILGVLLLLGALGWFLASYWVSRNERPLLEGKENNDSGAKSIITNLFPRGARGARNYRNTSNNGRGRHSSNHSIQSLPSRYSRYN
ncbi:hypothetical protein TPHA_0P01390 [Tetrapisispora phaffii CBS 4417]|uniref:Uncharacterized protein n=1 Tax=Tetrapisispora phaffii (strain ATCC 24235 / CBS 4417 / NBRC 1672 / NRRL Y-8282 / UCD 70-5) TaxID=1071381 RepID=G8C2B9_TETPH|nr:hypothetical protein TPHA_0P01390 [Tetrapisispora phaffii CBS 4417]CCE66297.1 hypothetical protein TPHA_0P01390 [Tetrapisispora phaffii CBS 4417]